MPFINITTIVVVAICAAAAVAIAKEVAGVMRAKIEQSKKEDLS